MDQGFWLFFIFQLVALGLLAERMNLVGLRRMALMAGIGGSLGVALLVHILTYGGIGSEGVRPGISGRVSDFEIWPHVSRL